MKPYKEITTVKQTYVGIQKNVETIYHILYLQANCLSTHLLVETNKARTTTRQMYHHNP